MTKKPIFVYTEPARKRISKLGTAAVTAFLDELPVPNRNLVLTGLPRLDGFRKNSPLELKERTKLFVTGISHATGQKYKEHDVEWMAFTVAWLHWAKNVLQIELHKFEGNSQTDLVKYVIGELGEANCPREDLERLVLFSYLPDDVECATFLSSLPGRDELRRRRDLAELPSRMSEIRERVDEVVLRLQKMELKAVEAKSNTASVGHICDLEPNLRQLRERVEGIEHGVSEGRKASDGSLAEIIKRVEKDEDGLAKLSKSVGGILPTLTRIEAEIPELRTAVTGLKQNLAELAHRVEQIADRMLETKADIAPRSNGAQVQTILRSVELGQSVHVKALDGLTSMIQLLTENFSHVGVLNEDAEIIARVVAAGIVAGQLITFTGSLADLLADVACASIFGSERLEVDVPIGLYDGTFASVCIENFITASQNSAIIFRGINCSAFEVYGGAIRSQLVDRQLGRADKSAYRGIFATTCSGSSVLDANEGILSLGPLIDSDHLRWGVPKWKKVRPGSFKDTQLQSLFKAHEDLQDLIHTVAEILKCDRRPNHLRRLFLIRAASSVELISNLDNSIRQELLLASWVIPYLRAQEVATDELRTFIFDLLEGNPKSHMLTSILDDVDET